jgi:hypothetical protein
MTSILFNGDERRQRDPRHKNWKIEDGHRKDEIEQSGKKRCQNHNSHQQFPNGRAKIITVGTQEV